MDIIGGTNRQPRRGEKEMGEKQFRLWGCFDGGATCAVLRKALFEKRENLDKIRRVAGGQSGR